MASKKRRRRQQARAATGGHATRGPRAAHDAEPAPEAPAVATPPPDARGRSGDRAVPAVVAALTFVVSFVLYLLTLAPTVTFEDSGELAAAAYNLGVPHEPGYPLWTMLGWTFTHLRFGDVAYRLNLMSAFFSALGAALVALAVLVVVRGVSRTAGVRGDGVVACGAAVAAGVLCATAQSTWEQSLITEVYGLNTFFVGLLLVLLAVYGRGASLTTRRNAWWAVCLTLGLALTNHPTVVLLIPVALVWMLVLNYRPAERALRLGAGRLALGAAWFAAGLLPLLYLPLASRRDPILDWGDPETWTTFRRVVTRHQYGSGPASGLPAMAHEVWAYFGLLWDQWFPLLLALVAVGLVALWLHHRRFLWLALALWVATGPVTTIVTDFPLDTASAQANAEDRALVSVFYIPSYMVLAFVAGVGLAWLLGLAVRRLVKGDGRRPLAVTLPLSAAVVVALVLVAIPTYRTVDMSGYRFAQAYVHNVLDTASPDSLVMGDRDQFVFPLMYAQMVEGRRPDVVVLDQELLRRSWYIEMLRHDQPELMAAVKPQADAFVAAVAPFENGKAYDGAAIDAAYYGLIKALVDQYEKNGRDVYFTYAPPDVVAQDYRGEPLGAAWRTRTTPPGKTPAKIADWLTPVDPSAYDFAGLTAGEQRLDRNALLIRRYYGELLGARAQLLAQAGETEEAARLQALAQHFVAQE